MSERLIKRQRRLSGLDHDQFLTELRVFIARDYPTKGAFCDDTGISRQTLSMIFKKKQMPSKAILERFGYMIDYQPLFVKVNPD